MIKNATLTGDDGVEALAAALKRAESAANADPVTASRPVIDDDEALLREVMNLPGGERRSQERREAMERVERIFKKAMK
ncbi:hypothetical protein EBZ80_12935 [bacterium]|nr:hypothetical protein [bacterium]